MKKFKKTLLIALSFVLVAVVSVASTLAYLSAQDSSASVWTSGKVNIELNEQQRNEEGTALEDFKQGKELLPLVGSAQGEKDAFGMPKAANYMDKIVTVKNTGRNDAWVRVLIGFPKVLDDEDASKMPLHWNLGNNFAVNGDYPEGNVTSYNWAPEGLAYTVNLEGIDYNVYSFTYKTALAAGEETLDPAIIGFYLDSRVNYDADREVYTITYDDGTYDLEGFDGNVVIPVIAQAVQYDGFETSAATAFEEAFPVNENNLNTWFSSVGVTVAKPAANAVRPAGYTPAGTNQTIDGITIIDNSDENTNLRALYNPGARLVGDFTVSNSYLDGTYAMNVYGDGTGNLVVTNTALRGWVSYSGFKTATFKDCTFGQNTNPEYYNVVRPYSTVTFENCEFDGTEFYFDKLPTDATVTFVNCTMNGELIDSLDDINVTGNTDVVVFNN